MPKQIEPSLTNPFTDLIHPLKIEGCSHDGDAHPGITAYILTVHNTSTGDSSHIGHLHAQTIDTNPTDGRMFQEYQMYDACHAPGGMLHKVENYVSNEAFLPLHEAMLTSAERILFIAEVRVEERSRGRGIGLQMVQSVVRELLKDRKGVVLLQPAPIGRDGRMAEEDVQVAVEKLGRHWARLGFEAWSGSDESWMCLGLGYDLSDLGVIEGDKAA